MVASPDAQAGRYRVAGDAGPRRVWLAGSAAAADAPEGTAVLTAMPLTVDFGEVAAGDSTGPLVMVTLINSGNRSTGPINTQLTFTNASQFRIVNDGCKTGIVAPLGECVLQLQFRPESPAGAMMAMLLVDATPGGEVSVALTGTAIVDTRPRLSSSSGLATFGDRAIGSTSAPFSFTISNLGATPTGAITVQLMDPSAPTFNLTTDCGTPLGPTDTCAVHVGFESHVRGLLPGLGRRVGQPRRQRHDERVGDRRGHRPRQRSELV